MRSWKINYVVVVSFKLVVGFPILWRKGKHFIFSSSCLKIGSFGMKKKGERREIQHVLKK